MGSYLWNANSEFGGDTGEHGLQYTDFGSLVPSVTVE